MHVICDYNAWSICNQFRHSPLPPSLQQLLLRLTASVDITRSSSRRRNGFQQRRSQLDRNIHERQLR
jgi:hypothetical protein